MLQPVDHMLLIYNVINHLKILKFLKYFSFRTKFFCVCFSKSSIYGFSCFKNIYIYTCKKNCIKLLCPLGGGGWLRTQRPRPLRMQVFLRAPGLCWFIVYCFRFVINDNRVFYVLQYFLLLIYCRDRHRVCLFGKKNNLQMNIRTKRHIHID